ncbi:MAG TPA: TIGR00730 family Rossman fold protein [Stellaceae bacterium]|nr:TIGR00730 family Rossman fold protein [Stellaceae bacterium]
MQQIRRLCVYCGSSGEVGRRYREAASELGACLTAAGIGVVYGGGRVGLMGLLADAALAGGGEVIGIIPARLRDAELAHPGATELVVVDSMHERKREMAERADAFAILPGGIGTLDEMFEILSWKQLELHDKPIFIVDIDGYWAPLGALLEHIVATGFARPETRGLVQTVPNVATLMAALAIEPAPSRDIDPDVF